jgi:hypothetical protein
VRNPQWRPRHGASLMERRKVGRIEHRARDLARRVPKAFLYPPVAIVLGVLIVFSGRGELLLRSWGALLIGLWLAFDLWAWLLKKEENLFSFKFVIGWTGTSFILIGVMGIMWWWMDGKLRDQRDNVHEKLVLSVLLPPGEADPVASLFTVTNNSSNEIASYSAYCLINKIMYDKTVVQAHPPNDWTFAQRAKSSPFPLHNGGGSDSFSCLDRNIIGYDFKCADVTMKVNYNLAIDDDGTLATKDFRFVTGSNQGRFQWMEKNPEDTQIYCLELKPTVPKQPSSPNPPKGTCREDNLQDCSTAELYDKVTRLIRHIQALLDDIEWRTRAANGISNKFMNDPNGEQIRREQDNLLAKIINDHMEEYRANYSDSATKYRSELVTRLGPQAAPLDHEPRDAHQLHLVVNELRSMAEELNHPKH